MADQLLSGKTLLIGTFVALFAAGVSGTALAKTYSVNCNKNDKLQHTIDRAVNGDVLEITGICMENILIADKALTLVGATARGPHGITGVSPGTDGVRIEHSRGTHLEGLQINNPHYSGVRIRFSSAVTMTDCEVSNSAGGEGSGIWVMEMSEFTGTRLRLDNNWRGLAAYKHSEATCMDCDLNDNTRNAALSWKGSVVSLVNSSVTGERGIQAFENSYIDIDCVSYDSSHACGMDVTRYAGYAYQNSKVILYHSGDFSGWVEAYDRSIAQLLGARQLVNPGRNTIDDNSSLRVESGISGESHLTGDTEILGFSNAQFYSDDSKLSGSLTCGSGGDAWAEPSIDLSNITITGCMHAP